MKKVLVCLDSSPRAPKILAAAIDLARRSGARLTLFRSVGLPPDIAHEDIMGIRPGEIIDRMTTSAKEALVAYRTSLEGTSSALIEAVEVRVGTPWDAICREAKRCDCDLIMIGSHGYGGIDRLLGTTASKVVNHAECSVLVVR